MYRTLARSWGPQHWWPAETAFEVIAGAILTQNTSWKNVERALASLRAANALNMEGIREIPLAELEQLIRSSGYYRQKAGRLKQFVAFVDEKYSGSLASMFATPTQQLRKELLALKGIGPETADAILLYAGHHEIFVVDAYARRILARHGVIASSTKYDEVRGLIEGALRAGAPVNSSSHTMISGAPAAHEPSAMSSAKRTPLAQIYNEMHGILVQVGKLYCHKEDPKCPVCPLSKYLSDGLPWIKPT
jgi:endonuclease-3 related protein